MTYTLRIVSRFARAVISDAVEASLGGGFSRHEMRSATSVHWSDEGVIHDGRPALHPCGTNARQCRTSAAVMAWDPHSWWNVIILMTHGKRKLREATHVMRRVTSAAPASRRCASPISRAMM